MEAGEAGADYVAFGAFYSDQHQGNPAPARTGNPELVVHPVRAALRRDRRDHADNARPLVDAGADFVAVLSAVWAHPDGPAAAVRAFEAVLRR